MLEKYVSLIFVILISGCGGSSGSTQQTQGVAGITNVVGQVIDAATATPLSGVRVSAVDETLATVTGSDGRFELGPVQSANFIDLTFTLDGYLPELYKSASLNLVSNELGIVQLIPINERTTGSIGGTVRNTQGDVLVGVLLRFLAGINVLEGTAVATTTTNSAGRWSIASLPAGNYTCIILVDGQEPIYETVQIIGDRIISDADVIAPTTSSPPTDQMQITFPEERTYSDYGPAEVTWSFSMFTYEATAGSYRVDRNDKTGTNQVTHTIGPDINPLAWRDSTLTITHSFAGPGVYPVVNSKDELVEAAQMGRAAALVSMGANGPMGTIGFARLEDFVTLYEPAENSGGSITVTVDGSGRYRFDIGGLSMVRSRFNFPDALHPDGPENITLNVSNAYVP